MIFKNHPIMPWFLNKIIFLLYMNILKTIVHEYSLRREYIFYFILFQIIYSFVFLIQSSKTYKDN
jgi:hypothetical protein